MAIKCIKCFRPRKTCLCSRIEEVDTGIKFLFLMHPKEAYKIKTGTGRLSHLTLKDSEIVIDTTFDNNRRVKELLSDPDFTPVILFPHKESLLTREIKEKIYISGKRLLIILIDATWDLAKKMILRSPSLMDIPKITFSNSYESQFKFKKQPMKSYLSTIETCYYLINELKSEGLTKDDTDSKPLMDIFKTLVDFQIKCELESGYTEL